MRPRSNHLALALTVLMHLGCGSGSGSGNASGTGGTGGGGSSNLEAQIVPDVSGRVDGVALHGEWAFLATLDVVHVYKNSAGTWTPHSQLTPSTTDTSFLGAIDTDGTTLGVLTTRSEQLPRNVLHHIELRVYGLEGDAWVEQLVVEVEGEALALDGDLSAVGDPEGADGTAVTGLVHMVRRDASPTGVVTTLTVTGAIGGSDIGEAVALHAGVVAATCQGIFCDDDKIHLWTSNGTDSWLELAPVLAPSGAAGNFGRRIALHSNVLLAGLTPSEDEGSILAYDVTANTWLTGITPDLPLQWVVTDMDFDGSHVVLAGNIQDPDDRDEANFPRQHGRRLDIYAREGDAWVNVAYEQRAPLYSTRDVAIQGNAGVAVWATDNSADEEIEFFQVP